MPGTLVVTTLSDGTNSTSATNCISGSAKAWVNFNGTTSPGTIRASYNVSSVTRNGTGDYTINFTSTLADANYSVVCTASSNYGVRAGGAISLFSTGSPFSEVAPTTSSARVYVTDSSASALDAKYVCVSVFR